MSQPEVYQLRGVRLARALVATPITYKGEPVLTYAAIDMIHDRPKGTAKKAFSRNRKRFVNGKHYHLVPAELLNFSHGPFRGPRASGGLADRDRVVFTKRGYTMLVKPMGDDQAWEVQEELSDSYWAKRDGHEELALRHALTELRSDLRANRARTEALLDVVDDMTRAEAGHGARAMNRRKRLKRLCDDLREPVLEFGRPEFWLEGDEPSQTYLEFDAGTEGRFTPARNGHTGHGVAGDDEDVEAVAS